MLFDESIRRELARSFGATLVVLLTVVMTMLLVRTLGQAYKGSVGAPDIVLILGYTVLAQLPTILGLSLFIAVVAVLSRMYRDSEMAVWFAAGQPLVVFLRPLLRFAWPPLLGIAVLGLVLLPWSNRQVEQIRIGFEQRADVDRIAPGEFQQSADGSRVFFVDKDADSDAAARNLFIVAQEAQGESVISAQGAHVQADAFGRSAILVNGQRLQIRAKDGSVTLAQFAQYGSQIRSAANARLGSVQEQRARSADTHELLGRHTPIDRAELLWRVGLPLAAGNLVLLGLGLSSVKPRAGGSASLMLALFAFIVYYNLMTLAQSWVAAGRIGMLAAAAWLHGGALALAWLALLARQQHWSWRAPWPLRRHTPAAGALP